MNRILSWWRAESPRIASIILALVAAGLIDGTIGKILGAVIPVLLGQAVRQTVWAPATVEKAVEATGLAVASQLTSGTAGAAGEVTDTAQAVVDGVVAGALGQS